MRKSQIEQAAKAFQQAMPQPPRVHFDPSLAKAMEIAGAGRRTRALLPPPPPEEKREENLESILATLK